MKRIVTFGEIMLRIKPSISSDKIIQTKNFIIESGGSESNVAISLSQLGNNVMMITKLPRNDLAEIILHKLKSYDIETSNIAYGGDKLGVYWTEKGIGPRPSKVIYDRNNSSFSTIKYNDFKWNNILKDADWFHISGITPAICENTYLVLKKIIEKINDKIELSIDLNYRDKLWQWANGDKTKINQIISDLCNSATIIIGNETDFQNCLNYKGDYQEIAEKCFLDFPKLKYIAISLRDSISATENNLSGLLFYKENEEIKKIKGETFKIKNIIDRLGTGDSFASGIIHGLIHNKNDYKQILDFAISLFTLNHTISGDHSQFKIEDIKHFLKTNGSGRVIR